MLTPLAAALSGCSKGAGRKAWSRSSGTAKPVRAAAWSFPTAASPAQLRGGPKDTVVKFDDIGCMTFWIATNQKTCPGWPTRHAHVGCRFEQQGQGSHLARPAQAQFITKTSPMGYNFGAVAYPQMGSLDFESMRQHVLAKGK
jgi:copper chaperone NosL